MNKPLELRSSKRLSRNRRKVELKNLALGNSRIISPHRTIFGLRHLHVSATLAWRCLESNLPGKEVECWSILPPRAPLQQKWTSHQWPNGLSIYTWSLRFLSRQSSQRNLFLSHAASKWRPRMSQDKPVGLWAWKNNWPNVQFKHHLLSFIAVSANYCWHSPAWIQGRAMWCWQFETWLLSQRYLVISKLQAQLLQLLGQKIWIISEARTQGQQWRSAFTTRSSTRGQVLGETLGDT